MRLAGGLLVDALQCSFFNKTYLAFQLEQKEVGLASIDSMTEILEATQVRAAEVDVDDVLVVEMAYSAGSARMQEQALVTPIAEAIPSAVKGDEL